MALEDPEDVDPCFELAQEDQETGRLISGNTRENNDTSGEEASSARGVGQRREVAAHTPAHRTKPPDLKKRRCSGSASLNQIPFAISAQQFCARVAWSV
ncbi:hypothetical protein [Phyllobacterium endophyticum]|uniref:hypothetical protein n=1 Tax=Phyllobacterium endophyticum TaxID=1149773 RepID=UPI0011B2048E|nr:hypothetical protein [Phyllobacterium endophyticum]MBB3237808.1 hypothetical protein [Phyllobacterium endophyticum]TYR42424.1 hypothetical protein FY050_14600 [Phyllobacterium endophyticum]